MGKSPKKSKPTSSLNYTRKRRKAEVGTSASRSKKAKNGPTKNEVKAAMKVLVEFVESLMDRFSMVGEVPETIPIGAEGTAYLVGRDKDQELVIHPIPAADKICRSEANGDAIYFSNT